MIHRPIARLCMAMAGFCGGFPSSIFAQLPSESTLPGRSPVAAVALPDESKLPPGFTLVQIPFDETEPAHAQPSPTEPLPGESVLPPAAQRPAPAENGDNGLGPAGADVLNLARSADAIPWLRLAMQGHAGPVRALAFSGDSARLCSAGEDKAVRVWVRAAQENRWRY